MLRIAQDQDSQGHDWWTWSVRIEGSAAELEPVEKVVWRLHPTFNPSEVESRNRAEGFRLDTSGWGTFRLSAVLHRRGGTTKTLQHDLELFYPEHASAPTKDERRPDVEAFVHALDLPTSKDPPRDAAPRSEALAMDAPLVVVGRQIVAFDDTVPVPVRLLLCQGLLLADLAVRSRRDSDGLWLPAYVSVLGNLGWVLQEQATAVREVGGRGGTLHAILGPILASALKLPADNPISRLLAAADDSYLDAPWFALLDRKSRADGASGIGFTAMQGDGSGGARLRSAFLTSDALRAGIQPLLFRHLGPSETLNSTIGGATISAAALAATHDALAVKLGPFLADNIRRIDR